MFCRANEKNTRISMAFDLCGGEKNPFTYLGVLIHYSRWCNKDWGDVEMKIEKSMFKMPKGP